MNRRSASLAAPYLPRVTPSASVSTPLTWDELEGVYLTQFDILNVLLRLEQAGHPWARILDEPVDLREFLRT